jgi:hypothetical protein
MRLQRVIPWRIAHQHCPASASPAGDKVIPSVNRYRDNGNIAAPVNFNRLPEHLAA